MAAPAVAAAGPSAAARAPRLAPFLAVFFLSGFAALVYQMIWQRLLTFFGGADVRAVTIIVAAFMAGLGLGSLAGGYWADRLGPRGRILAFCACELAVALFGFASVPLFYDLLYIRLGPMGLSTWTMGAVIFLALLWPTSFMGASLPLLSRALTASIEGAGARIGALYGWNTFGAAVGSFLAVWGLVRVFGFRTTVEIAAATNLLCALAAILAGRAAWRGPAAAAAAPAMTAAAPAAPTALFSFRTWAALYALSGFIALSLEIVWFRLLGVLLKSNSFTFATLLGLYLAGLGLGALAAGRVARRAAQPARVFLALQSGIAIYAALSLAALVALLRSEGPLARVWAHAAGYDPIPFGAAVKALFGIGPATPGSPGLALLFLDLYLWVPLALILPPTVLMGMSFPFLQQATQTELAVLGRRVGWLQVANIAGSTVGAVVTGVLLLHWLGSAWTLRLLVVLSAAFLALLVAWGEKRRGTAAIKVAAALAVALAVAAAVPSPARLWARLHGTTPDRIVYAEDGSGVSVLRDEGTDEAPRTIVFVSGLGQSGLPFGNYHTVLGALPVMLHPDPREVAVIGLGSGDTAFGVGGRKETQRIDCIEIVASQLPTLRALDRRHDYIGLRYLLADGRIRHVVGDGRAFLMRGGLYDVIEADALRPSSAYAGNLYSAEYFELMRRHLKPGGLAVSWSPTERTRDTFARVFPHVLVFGGTLVGSNQPIPYEAEALRARLKESSAYYAAAGIDIERLMRRAYRKAPVRYGPGDPRPQAADINTDLFPRDEYLVPRSAAGSGD